MDSVAVFWSDASRLSDFVQLRTCAMDDDRANSNPVQEAGTEHKVVKLVLVENMVLSTALGGPLQSFVRAQLALQGNMRPLPRLPLASPNQVVSRAQNARGMAEQRVVIRSAKK